jgi:hypothetical protein
LALTAVPVAARRKGGTLSGRAGGAKLTNELAKGGVGVAEPFGHIFLAAVIDEDGTQGFVVSLGRTEGLKEEGAAESIVHGRAPECEVVCSWRSCSSYSNG